MKRLLNCFMIQSHKGFTLVELLTVVGIIGILITGVLATLDPIGQIQKGRDAKRKNDLAEIQRALETYYQDNGFYPSDTGNGSCYYQIAGDNGDSNGCIEWGKTWSPYMSRMPKENLPQYRYVYYSTGQTYYLYAYIERRGKDVQACNTNGSACANALSKGVTCGSSNAVCNFGVSSSNTTP